MKQIREVRSRKHRRIIGGPKNLIKHIANKNKQKMSKSTANPLSENSIKGGKKDKKTGAGSQKPKIIIDEA